MKPYYDHAGITIYHGDCMEVLTQLDQTLGDATNDAKEYEGMCGV